MGLWEEILLLTTLQYSLPRCEAIPGVCDTIKVVCATPDSCDTLRICTPERGLAKTRIYWHARWAPASRLLREKLVGGREGQDDTLQVPSDTIATVWVTAVDSAGNESCASNLETVNLPPTGVESPTWCIGDQYRWFDVAGRHHQVADDRPIPPAVLPSGIYWRRHYRRAEVLESRRFVVLR